MKIINLIFSLLIIAGDVLYITLGGLYLKAMTSVLFVLLGAINLIYVIKYKYTNSKFAILLIVGLFFAMLGDIVLNLNFIGGAILFAIGHVMFFISYMFIKKLKWLDLIFGLAIFIPSCLIITLLPIFTFDITMELVCVVYAFIISMMVGKALSNFVAVKDIITFVVLIGSCLFFISDLMLLLNVFAHLPKVIDILCLATYYPAEIMLAISPVSKKLFNSKIEIN